MLDQVSLAGPRVIVRMMLEVGAAVRQTGGAGVRLWGRILFTVSSLGLIDQRLGSYGIKLRCDGA